MVAGKKLLIPIGGVAKLLSISRAQAFRMAAAGRLPKPVVRLGRRAPRWSVAEINDWISSGCPDAKTWESRRQQSGAPS